MIAMLSVFKGKHRHLERRNSERKMLLRHTRKVAKVFRSLGFVVTFFTLFSLYLQGDLSSKVAEGELEGISTLPKRKLIFSEIATKDETDEQLGVEDDQDGNSSGMEPADKIATGADMLEETNLVSRMNMSADSDKDLHSVTRPDTLPDTQQEPLKGEKEANGMRSAAQQESEDDRKLAVTNAGRGEAVNGDGSEESGRGQQLNVKDASNVEKDEKSNEGSRSGSFWQWFQGSKASQPMEKTQRCPAGGNQRLCEMFLKLLRKLTVQRVFDASCRKNVKWMPTVLRRMEEDFWGFKYYCAEHEGSVSEDVKSELKEYASVEFVELQWWREKFPSDIDLLFAWDTLPHSSYGRVYKFFLTAKQSNTSRVLFDNYPGIVNSPSPNRQYLNVRKHPFRFPRADVVVQNVTEEGEGMSRQLLLYKVKDIPLPRS